jgi:hypothetical protein
MLNRLVTAAGALTVLTVGAEQAAAQDAAKPKVSKTIVAYQDEPKGNQTCANCINFQPPSACKVVEGEVTTHGWCRAYAPKG